MSPTERWSKEPCLDLLSKDMLFSYYWRDQQLLHQLINKE